MNPLLKKEIRLLLPAFGVCCALALPNLFFQFNPGGSFQSWWLELSFLFCGAMAVMLALNSFGVEISSGTFSNLLSQPVSRQKIWDAKISLLAVSLVIIGIFWCGCGIVRLKIIGHGVNLLDLFTGVSTFGLVVFSGGLWTVLLLRQVAAAFWFTILVPGVILVIHAGLFADYSDEFQEGMIVSVLGLYSLAGFLFARWLFLRAQDVTWTGGTIAMPEMRGLPVWFSRSAARRVFRPRAALFWKEVQLHQAQFIMAGVLALLHLVVLAMRKFGSYQKNSSTEFILEIFWCLWLVMPMLVGAAAVAEERKLGTLAGQFCLPVRRRTQFAEKFSVAMLLSVLFGVVMPLLLEGRRILPDVHFEFNPSAVIAEFHASYGRGLQMSTAQNLFWICVTQINQWLPLLMLAGMAMAIGAISFYASTLTRNTLQALAPSVLGFLLTYFLFIVISQHGNFGFFLSWNGPLIYFIGVPVFFIVLVAMSSWNFQRINLGWNVWRRNAFVFVAALAFVFVATTAIYHRVWEKLTPFEPPHGAAWLTLSNPATLNDQGNTLSVRLPDGRIWTDDFGLNTGAQNPLALFLGHIWLTSFGDGHFLEGSNWVDVIRDNWQEQIGIKTDGSLWVSETPRRMVKSNDGRWNLMPAGQLVQFGSETNWSSMVVEWPGVLLLKKDGTLWRWGDTNRDIKYNDWPGLRSITPQRWRTNTNWSRVFLAANQRWLQKTDGTVWAQPNYRAQMTKSLERGHWLGFAETIQPGTFELGVCADGTFRIWAEQWFGDWQAVDLQLGKDTNWLNVAGRGEKIVTLKNDGSLWLWNFQQDYRRGWTLDIAEREMLDVKPVRLGTHSDWIAIASAGGGIISLAADGSLWYWPLESAGYIGEINGSLFVHNNFSTFKPLLDISRKPQLLGNIFGKTD